MPLVYNVVCVCVCVPGGGGHSLKLWSKVRNVLTDEQENKRTNIINKIPAGAYRKEQVCRRLASDQGQSEPTA